MHVPWPPATGGQHANTGTVLTLAVVLAGGGEVPAGCNETCAFFIRVRSVNIITRLGASLQAAGAIVHPVYLVLVDSYPPRMCTGWKRDYGADISAIQFAGRNLVALPFSPKHSWVNVVNGDSSRPMQPFHNLVTAIAVHSGTRNVVVRPTRPVHFTVKVQRVWIHEHLTGSTSKL